MDCIICQLFLLWNQFSFLRNTILCKYTPVPSSGCASIGFCKGAPAKPAIVTWQWVSGCGITHNMLTQAGTTASGSSTVRLFFGGFFTLVSWSHGNWRQWRGLDHFVKNSCPYVTDWHLLLLIDVSCVCHWRSNQLASYPAVTVWSLLPRTLGLAPLLFKGRWPAWSLTANGSTARRSVSRYITISGFSAWATQHCQTILSPLTMSSRLAGPAILLCPHSIVALARSMTPAAHAHQRHQKLKRDFHRSRHCVPAPLPRL